MLAGVGGVAVHGEARQRRHPSVPLVYGARLALIVDEFATASQADRQHLWFFFVF